jgi:hypothetical protein
MEHRYKIICGCALALLAAWSLGSSLNSVAGKASSAVTFSKDVAPIIQENCLSCHRPGQIAPMSFQNYKEVRPWAKAIRETVVKRVMPP